MWKSPGHGARHTTRVGMLVSRGGAMRGRETVILLKLHLPPEHDRCLHRAGWWGAHTEKRVGRWGAVGFWPTLGPHPGSEVQGGLQMLTLQHCCQQLEGTFVDGWAALRASPACEPKARSDMLTGA